MPLCLLLLSSPTPVITTFVISKISRLLPPSMRLFSFCLFVSSTMQKLLDLFSENWTERWYIGEETVRFGW